jgi:fumarate reductase flavoprotein subunit
MKGKSKRRRSGLVVFLAALAGICTIAGGFAACSSTPKASGGYKAGSYTAKGQGIHGEVLVSVKFSESAILEVKVLKNEETQGIGDAALQKIADQIVKGQSLDIDVVSGASISSKAILAAVEDCVKQAGGDVAGLKAKKAVAQAAVPARVEKSCDVVIVGGGGAGLAAAVSAAQGGAKVILIEKSSALGGNTIRAGGAYNAVDPKRQDAVKMSKPLMNDLKSFLDMKESDFGEFGPTLAILKGQIRDYVASGSDKLFDSVELHMIQTYLGGKRVDLKGNEIHGNLELVRTLCTGSPKSIEWLESLGLKYTDSIGTVLGALWPRTHGTAYPVGTGFIKVLSENAQKLGVEIMLETKGEELTMANGRVTGIRASAANGGSVLIKASKGVVMATGGFSANPEMCAKYNTYWPTIPKTMGTTNTPNATGDGIVMGEKAGANLVGMGFIQLMPSSDPVNGSLGGGLWGSAESQVFVNSQGKRFVNEYAERDVLASAALKQDKALFYIICDQETAGNPQPGSKNGWGDDVDNLIKTKHVYKADTIEGLEAQLGMPKGSLVAEIAKYNSYIEAGKDPDFGKANFGPKIDVGPFYATPRSPSLHHTMGGLAIDTSARVLDASGKTIPGFYAAGEVTGGIHAGNRLGGNAIADIMTFGRIAGASAAASK